MPSFIDSDYVPSAPRKKKAPPAALICESEGCGLPTNHRCPVCSKPACNLCILRDDRLRCESCAKTA
jgi:hypothetical protein